MSVLDNLICSGAAGLAQVILSFSPALSARWPIWLAPGCRLEELRPDNSDLCGACVYIGRLSRLYLGNGMFRTCRLVAGLVACRVGQRLVVLGVISAPPGVLCDNILTYPIY